MPIITQADIAVRIKEVLYEAGIEEAFVQITYRPPVAVRKIEINISTGATEVNSVDNN